MELLVLHFGFNANVDQNQKVNPGGKRKLYISPQSSFPAMEVYLQGDGGRERRGSGLSGESGGLTLQMGKRRERGRKKGKSDGLGGPGLIIKGDSRRTCNELGSGSVRCYKSHITSEEEEEKTTTTKNRNTCDCDPTKHENLKF